jgi:hypothetical protein
LFDQLAAANDPSQREALLLALERHPIAEVRAAASKRLEGGASDEERCTVLEVLGRCGLAMDIDTMIRVAEGAQKLGDGNLVPPALTKATARLLSRDARTYARIGVLLPAAAFDVREALFAAIAQNARPESLLLLARLARDFPPLAPTSLARLGIAGAHAPRPVDDEVLGVVHGILAASGSPSLPEAVLAAGCLDDDASIPRLIDLLDDRRPGVRANAQWSLEALSGLGILGGSEGWRAWHRSEEAWFRTNLPKVKAALLGRDRGRIAGALEAIAGRHCRRHELAGLALPMLQNEDPEIAALACDTLRHLRSTVAVPDLQACLKHPSLAVRVAAEQALEAITAERQGSGGATRSQTRRRGISAP